MCRETVDNVMEIWIHNMTSSGFRRELTITVICGSGKDAEEW